MHDQPKYRPYRPSAFFEDRRSMRPAVEGAVARGHLNDDPWMFAGKKDGTWASELPLPVSAELIRHGRERYDIYCSPCHARTGRGDGMIVRRGYRKPPSFHEDRLRAAPPGYLFDVVTRGFGTMPDYAAQIEAKDRWAIVAYIRALQLSQNATLADVPVRERERLVRTADSGGNAK
jgi:mono/diheme cytochrome c family protein